MEMKSKCEKSDSLSSVQALAHKKKMTWTSAPRFEWGRWAPMGANLFEPSAFFSTFVLSLASSTLTNTSDSPAPAQPPRSPALPQTASSRKWCISSLRVSPTAAVQTQDPDIRVSRRQRLCRIRDLAPGAAPPRNHAPHAPPLPPAP